MLERAKGLPSAFGSDGDVFSPHVEISCVGVATHACRQSTNGRDMLAKISHNLNIKLSVISQEEEGHSVLLPLLIHPFIPPSHFFNIIMATQARLGFQCAMLAVAAETELLNGQRTIKSIPTAVWDMGGGSYQLVGRAANISSRTSSSRSGTSGAVNAYTGGVRICIESSHRNLRIDRENNCTCCR